MPRKKRPLDRDGGVVRDASLIVIAFRRHLRRQRILRAIQGEEGAVQSSDRGTAAPRRMP